MALPRFFLSDRLGATEGVVDLPLASGDARHAVSVLRVKAGDDLEVVEADGGGIWRVRVSDITDGRISVRLGERLEAGAGPRVTLVQGVAKGEKMDDIVRHAVEIGADAILPVLTERSIVRLDTSKRAEKGERWRRVARSAAEQSHRDYVPRVSDPAPLRDVTSQLAGFDAVVVFWEEASGQGLESALQGMGPGSDARVAVVIGPEGGFSEEEVDWLVSAGARVASLGDGILRTESAALVAVALVVHHLGGLGRD